MGLLDEAIREHLELKRRHGADPGDLAKLEREAFGPIRRGAEPAEPAGVPEPEAPADPVLTEPEVDAPEPAPAGIDADVTWEEPAQETQAFDPAEVAAAEGRRAEPSKDGDAEDVLEETPEFLQETPEHDRLWFEQKPPRDFDFDG
jgi:hypothetical protein